MSKKDDGKKKITSLFDLEAEYFAGTELEKQDRFQFLYREGERHVEGIILFFGAPILFAFSIYLMYLFISIW